MQQSNHQRFSQCDVATGAPVESSISAAHSLIVFVAGWRQRPKFETVAPPLEGFQESLLCILFLAVNKRLSKKLLQRSKWVERELMVVFL